MKKLLLLLAVLFAFVGHAQLSDLHYLPPLKQGQDRQGIDQQTIHLSTPEPTAFTVNAYRGTNPTPIATFNISNVAPAVYNTLGRGDNNITLVDNANTGIVLTNSGLRFESPSGNRFYVNYRGSSAAQSASLTSKGRVAMGTRFKWGGVPNLGRHPSKSNTLGIMATEDNTTVTLSGYDPDCSFRLGNNVTGITANSYTITLDANESFVFENYVGNNDTAANSQGWIGASVVSDKDIVISNGSINFGRQVGASNRDAGIDQPVPENRLGKDYVFVRGNGNANGWTEFPLIIATADNTQITVNGSATPIATINNGEYFQIPSNLYSSNTVGANMFVQTSKDAYAYQCMAGASTAYTQGLNFVAPVNCLLPDVMDNIPDIRNMAGTDVSGGLTIIAAVNTPDANIVVSNGTTTVPLPASRPVAGSSDWKTFYLPNLDGNISVQSTGPMAIGFFGYNGARGVAGYFSGFDTVPEVTLEVRGGTGCFVGSEIYEATGNFDAYQWYEDGVAIPGANSLSFAATRAGDYFVRGTKGPCTYDSQPITALYCDPDIIVNKTVDQPEIMEGETATFTIRVRNLGVGPVTNLQITDNIPTGLTLESATTITGNWSGNTWNIGTLLGGETATLDLEVRADEIDTLPLLSLINTVTNSQDQVDSNTTPDSPTAYLTVHNDYDNDGIRDVSDVDDDNDGIYDTDECNSLGVDIASGNGFSSTLSSTQNYLVYDIYRLDNSFNLTVNGIDVAGELQFSIPNSGNDVTFSDGFGYGQNGIGNVWTVSGAPGTPLLRVVIDESGQFSLYGTRTSNGPLEPMTLSTPANTVNWNSTGNNTVVINQMVVGPTNMRGNFLTTNCDTDADGIPDHLDLDSDGDGCTDANEFYKDGNADGGDGGEFGSGIPVVDTSGAVTTASYNQVFAPEILLGNTTENLGGTDINGQDVSLGQTIQYVLRFQNTGDDNAQNFTIRNILPANVSLDNVIVPVGSGITNSHDIATNTINFTIPNTLVQVGRPEYIIRITVTIAGNCTDFVAACSSLLENNAYVTYTGTQNTNTFSDEPGNEPISVCATAPEVASNSIFNDLSDCNEFRIAQLCNNSVILTAGSGFTTYNWVLDTNGNGQVDAGDTVMNDGDPDNDASTLFVTAIGDYIVEKSSNGSCPNMVERIRVERFGSTQTNPIIDFFNQVNSDNNPDNDLQGELVTCSVDQDDLQKIFLCGANDETTIQLGITDAQSITWEKLVEGSCTSSGPDCANKNLNCTWNPIATNNNFTVTESGQYRVVLRYQGGCPSTFYFNVFKNELVIDTPIVEDILCDTDGSIRITNVGSGYGFQLVDADNNDTVIVPFSANNGPIFSIANSGTYKVQVTQLDPSTGTPIPNSCIFETSDIGVLERDFNVNLTSTPADCNDLGTISIQALNVLPNYSYELRLDDGSNGGTGTFVRDLLASNDNTHTFTGVAPGNYIVVTGTDNGCADAQSIVVERTPNLSLSASLQSNITCTAGVINLTPGGGIPNASYQMAIWSKNGVDLYTDIAAIPASEIQIGNGANFLFGYTGNPATYVPGEEGTYTFIVTDGSGCSQISNAVTIEDLGSLSVTASHTQITCADTGTSSMTVAVTGGTAPYRYSLDGGITYQSTATFANLSAGFYEITVADSSGVGTDACTETITYEIDQPFRLTASPSIIEDAFCDPNGALVKILNPNGGQAPYEFSFDGGSTFGPQESRLLPGSHQLVLRDAIGCSITMEITVPNPIADPSFDQAVAYDCDGSATVTISPSNTTDFEYTYTLNGTLNTPAENNIFTNVAAGTQTVTVGYTGSITPDQSTLFFESFGAGPNTQIGEIGTGYCYEPQDGSTTNCNLGPAGILVDGEYSVTNRVTNPIPAYRNPNDHTGLTDGRFLAINPSNNLVGTNSIIWSRNNIEVLPNRDIDISFWAYNLRQNTSAGNNPEITIELVDAGGTVINSFLTAEIPKNTNADDWHNRTFTVNPGGNTVVGIVLRSSQPSEDGNELILDDIQASQTPEICEKTNDITVVVETGQAFEATLLSTIDTSCSTSTDGAIRFEVSNFDSATGFEYSTDGGTTWTTSLVSPVTTTANLAAGAYTVDVRKVADNSCTGSVSASISAPAVIVPQLTQIADYTCFNTGGTLEASATGGNPAYEYRIEDLGGAEIAAYQSSPIFPNIPDGTYVVRVRDGNGCETVSTTQVQINPPTTIDFDVTPTACYDGQNNASLNVSVNTGNGGYTFRINGGAWMTPTPATASTYSFTGLSNGSYDVEVTDSFGCVSPVETLVISPTLLAQVDVVDVSACADGNITVTPTGGLGAYSYAFLPTGTAVQDSDFSATDNIVITNATVGDYDVYVRDNGATAPYCQFLETVTVASSPILAFTAVPTDAICFGDTGSIAVNITSGLAPFTYQLVDVDNGTSNATQTGVMTTTRTYFNLTPGDYNVIVTDAAGCSVDVNGITVAEPDELTATVVGVTPASCTGNINDFGFEFSAYPTTLGTIEFSADGGTTWTGDNSNPGVSDRLTGYLSGDTVYPAMRTVDGFGNTVCEVVLDPLIVPYPLDDLDITISTVVVNCNELQVTVQGDEGTAPYEYAFSENPGNFNIATATWIFGSTTRIDGATVPVGEGLHQWTGLVPGRTYVFYVRDNNGCIRQSNVNVNDITVNPMDITADFEPSCAGANNGEITYTITDTDGVTEPSMVWTLFDVDGNTIQSSAGTVGYSTTITVNGLAPDEYYIQVQQIDGVGTPQCISASENLLLEELDPITANAPNAIQHISCENPGLILIENIQGGGGTYTYTVSGPSGFTLTGTPDNPIEIPANSDAGAYNVQVSDQFGCSYDLGDVNMTLTANPAITNIVVDNCSAAASVTITATTGSASMVYSLDNGTTYLNNGGVFNNVAPGPYTVFVKDANGCTDSRAITVNPSLQATASLTQNLGCGVGQEAELTLNVTAGSTNYEYEITNTAGTVIARQAMATTTISTMVSVADTYTVNVYDIGTSSPECNRTFTVVVPPAVLPSFTPNPTDVSCNGGSNGTIAISETNNGNNPLTYALVPNLATFNATTNAFENLPAGIYSVTATGPNGCTTALNNIQVDEPDPITFAAPTVNSFTCSSGNTKANATIVLDVSPGNILGGSGTYTRFDFVNNANGSVLQSGTSNSYTYTDNNGGDVIVRVIDANGCIGEQLVNVPAYDALGTPTIAIDDNISCSNLGEDISIGITSTVTDFASNPGNYQFRMLPTGAFQASNQFTDLQPGNYTFTIRNVSTGCEVTATHSVADPNTFDVTVNKLSDAVCFGDDGSITLAITDATYMGGFSWEIFNSNGTPADRSDDGAAILTGNSANIGPTAAINIPAGNYIVEVVQDAFPDCTQIRSFSIATPTAPLTLDTIARTEVGCSNDQGTALINPLGGMAPYDIQLTNTVTSVVANATRVNSNLFQGLTAGQYMISVTDALGCTQVFANAFELLLPDPINGTLAATDLACQDDTDATISLTLGARNVTSTYRYILNTYTDATASNLVRSTASQVTGSFNNLGSGFYTIEVLDTMGCTFESPITEIVNPTEVSAQLLTTQAIGCQQGATLSLTAQGGTAPYRWSTDGATFNPMNGLNGADLHEFQNVTPGSYQYFVIDSENCVSVISNEINVNVIEDLTVALDTSAALINCNGESSALIDATADGGLGNYQYGLFSDSGLTNEIRPYQADGLFTDLPQGTYYVSVLSEDCQVTSEVVTITEPDVMVATPTITDVLCNGDDNGSITVAVEGGTAPYQYAISPNLNQFDEANTFEDLAPGDYSVIVQDSKGCFELIEFSITEPEVLEMEVIVTPEYCVGEADGTITINPTGGTAPYSTSLNSNSDGDFTEDQLTYDNLTSGDYIVFIKDANGCETNQTVVVEEGVNINATVEVIYDCPDGTLGNSIEVTLEDRTERLYLLFALDSTDPSDLQLEPDFTNIAPGPHTLTIAHDNGCTRTFAFEVEAFEPLGISLEQRSLNEITVVATGGREGYTYLFNGIDNGDDETYYIKETGNYEVTVLDENGCEATASIFMEFIDIEIPNFFTPDGDGQNDLWIPRNIEQFPNFFMNIYDRYGRTVFRLQDNPEGWDGFYQENTLPTGDYWYVIKLNGEDDDREFVGNFTLYR
ncbi:T9SS type B sorting domain-containing protein [Maribacter chungangensis]|uniref:T9SS type B sorting domain-containing protein n=1 Tax=Maribacter chungangensis TaxID=1069117 RepID=A0ABW3B2J7_9FLAO